MNLTFILCIKDRRRFYRVRFFHFNDCVCTIGIRYGLFCIISIASCNICVNYRERDFTKNSNSSTFYCNSFSMKQKDKLYC